ncbi:MAG: N-acetylmuramoyl-L-alanine amidase [Candidatus Omnitrophota bacterium]|nr:N-acetylmuramoyl-L-alanine amidase [Candidatus Omnitrophota bacterium]
MFNRLLLFLGIIILLISGCATVPVTGGLSSYSIGGVSYLSLVSLCDNRGINWEYDLITRNILLVKDNHRISMRVGERMILVDDNPQTMRHPVDIYEGMVVVPYKFKEQVLDNLFKVYFPLTKSADLIPLKIKRIVIDAGHGGKDPGAIGRTGTREKHITLDIAKRLASSLKKEGIEVVLTRSTDVFVSLDKRNELTNNSQADMFVSIHANANRVKSLNGFEIYYVSSKVDDSARALSAAKNAKFTLGGYCAGYTTLELKAILWDMIYTSNRGESIKVADSICRNIKNDLDVRVIGSKTANFQVLKGARIPAILVEVGFLSNYSEEGFLKNSFYRQKIAESIKEGILNFARSLI